MILLYAYDKLIMIILKFYLNKLNVIIIVIRF